MGRELRVAGNCYTRVDLYSRLRTHDPYDSRLVSGMELPHQLGKMRSTHVRVDLRGGDAGVPEHGLHGTQIGAAFDEMGREGMAQHVRFDIAREARATCDRLDAPPAILSRQRTTRARQKEHQRLAPVQQGRAGVGQIFLQRRDCGTAHRHDAFFAPFAAGAQIAAIEIELRQIQITQFRDAQTARIKNVQHGMIANTGGRIVALRREELIDFGNRQHTRQAPTHARRFHERGGIVGEQSLSHEIREPGAHRGQHARCGAHGESGVETVGQKFADRFGGDVGNGKYVAARECDTKPPQIARIRLDRMPRQSPLHALIGEELIDKSFHRRAFYATRRRMSIFQQLRAGLRAIPAGCVFLARHRTLWPWALAPLLVQFMCFAAAIYFFARILAGAPESALPQSINAAHVFAIIAHWIFWIMWLFVTLISAFLMGQLASAPFNEMLATRTEAIVCAQIPTPVSFWKTLWRSLMVELQKTAWCLVLLGGLWFACLLPIVGAVFSAVGLPLVSMWIVGWMLTDFPCARRAEPFRVRLHMAKKYWAALVALGVVIWIPGLLVVANAPLVVAGTLLHLQLNPEVKDL